MFTADCFLGYLPKTLSPRPEWLAAPQVDWIASVSECISRAPPDRIELWKHNAMGLYDTESLARGAIPTGAEGGYSLFAYRAYLTVFREGIARDPADLMRLGLTDAEAELSGYESLGYDVVGTSGGGFFECSPLSCNGMASKHAVNRYCLTDSLDAAIALGREFSGEGSAVEPAWAYLAIEVMRRRDARPGG